jgi:ubiquinone/menaquinone biosynthesis C-methylase UbiE
MDTLPSASHKKTNDKAFDILTGLINNKCQILDLGAGKGHLARRVSNFLIHKSINPKKHLFATDFSRDIFNATEVSFREANFNNKLPFRNASFDIVYSIEVIEHLRSPYDFLLECFRILKPGGKLYLTTVNKKFSLTRNPWHVREYLAPVLRDLMKKHFSEVITEGVHGNQKVMDYYEENKVAVKKITRFDIFNLQYKLPRTWLQVPYDIANRMSRLSMSKSNNSLVSSIQVDDYFLSQDPDNSLDFFYTGIK